MLKKIFFVFFCSLFVGLFFSFPALSEPDHSFSAHAESLTSSESIESLPPKISESEVPQDTKGVPFDVSEIDGQSIETSAPKTIKPLNEDSLQNSTKQSFFDSNPKMNPVKHIYLSEFFNEAFGLDKISFSIPTITESVFPIYSKNYRMDKFKNSGTAFYIGDNRFVTNFHVISSAFLNKKLVPKMLFLSWSNGTVMIPFQKILALDFKNDLAVLELKQQLFKEIEPYLIPLELAPVSKISASQDGLIYGFPAVLNELVFSEVNFKGYKGTKTNDNLIINVNSTDLKGMSGSPVLIENQVVGVLKTSYENSVFATPSELLISLLEKPTHEENHLFYSVKTFLDLMAGVFKGDEESSLILAPKLNVVDRFVNRKITNIIKDYIKKGRPSDVKRLLSNLPDGVVPEFKVMIAEELYDNEEQDKALDIYESLAEEGYLPALLYLTEVAEEQGDDLKMVKLYEMAALKGDGYSSYFMGVYKEAVNLFFPGGRFEDTLTLPVSSEEWFKISLQQSYLPALFKLISFYREKGDLEAVERHEKLFKIYNYYHPKKIKKAYKNYKTLEKLNGLPIASIVSSIIGKPTLKEKPFFSGKKVSSPDEKILFNKVQSSCYKTFK